MATSSKNRYVLLIKHIFGKNYQRLEELSEEELERYRRRPDTA